MSKKEVEPPGTFHPRLVKRPVFARPWIATPGRRSAQAPAIRARNMIAPVRRNGAQSKQSARCLQDGAVHGSGAGAGGGAPGEDYDDDSAGGSGG
jgi:hypothetical protein